MSVDDIREYYSKETALANILQTHLRDRDGKPILLFGKDGISLEKSGSSDILSKTFFSKEFLGSSDELVRDRKKEKAFHFELNTELVINGKTEPGAEVFWGKRKIDIKPDGTFCIKLPLNEGVLLLDFLANSQDQKLSSKITTSVIRTKTETD